MRLNDYIRINGEEGSRFLTPTPVRSGNTGPPGRLYLPGGPVSARYARPSALPAAATPGRAGHVAHRRRLESDLPI